MFDNIGEKIKTLATAVCYIGIISSVIGGIVMIAMGDELIIAGIGTIICGSVASYVGSFFTYGFGHLIENSDKIVKGIAPLNKLNILEDINIKFHTTNITHMGNAPHNDNTSHEEYEEGTLDISVPMVPLNITSTDMVCPNCETRQSSRNKSCIICNQIFKL